MGSQVLHLAAEGSTPEASSTKEPRQVAPSTPEDKLIGRAHGGSPQDSDRAGIQKRWPCRPLTEASALMRPPRSRCTGRLSCRRAARGGGASEASELWLPSMRAQKQWGEGNRHTRSNPVRGLPWLAGARRWRGKAVSRRTPEAQRRNSDPGRAQTPQLDTATAASRWS